MLGNDYSVYLEYEEEELECVPQFSTIPYGMGEDSGNDLNNEEFYDDEETLEDSDSSDYEKYEESEEFENLDSAMFFIPIHLYRNPLVGCMEFKINFDPKDSTILHLVVVRYSVKDEDDLINGKWCIAGIYQTRRQAKEVEYLIQTDEFNSEEQHPWKTPNSQIDGIEVVSLRIED